jgi:hypothetical protein
MQAFQPDAGVSARMQAFQAGCRRFSQDAGVSARMQAFQPGCSHEDHKETNGYTGKMGIAFLRKNE